MRALSLFTGIGGFDLGLSRAGVSVVGMAEKDPQCRELLQSKFAVAVPVAEWIGQRMMEVENAEG